MAEQPPSTPLKMADTDPGENYYPAETMPYVSIGPTPETSITVTKATFDQGFILGAIILILIFVAGFTVAIYFAISLSSNSSSGALPASQIPQPPPRTITNQSNFGAVRFESQSPSAKFKVPADGSSLTTESLCVASGHGQWNGDHCDCISPFYGRYCSREKHSDKYLDVGIPNESILQFSVLEELTTDAKSFSRNGSTCSKECDKRSNCIGFIYHQPGFCTLLKDTVSVPSNETIPYSSDVDSTLYLKSTSNLFFEDRIFLSVAGVRVPNRYWLLNSGGGYAQIFPGRISKIHFIPKEIKMTGRYTGVYCLRPFGVHDAQTLIENGTNHAVYIHELDTELRVPEQWLGRPLYVTYI